MIPWNNVRNIIVIGYEERRMASIKNKNKTNNSKITFPMPLTILDFRINIFYWLLRTIIKDQILKHVYFHIISSQ